MAARSVHYLRAYLQVRTDFKNLKCSNISRQCGNACVPRAKKCRLTEAQLTKIVHGIEDEIKDLSYEKAVIINPKSGRVLSVISGEQTAVYIGPEDVQKMRGAIVTHNHPNLGWGKNDARAKGLSFSQADIEAAATIEVQEMRAVSSGYRHSLKPGKEGWNSEFWEKQIKPTYQQYSSQVYDEFAWKVMWGQMRRDVAEGDYHHEVIRRTANKLGMQYKREPITTRN